YVGGFFPPLLTWMRIISIRKDTLKDQPQGLGTEETDVTRVRLLGFPKPLREHMIVDPATDRRYLVMDEITPFLYRGIYPIAYEVDLQFLHHSDPRYKLPMPEVDMRNYRQLPYWS